MEQSLQLIHTIWAESKDTFSLENATKKTKPHLAKLKKFLKKDLNDTELFLFAMMAYLFVYPKADYLNIIAKQLNMDTWDIFKSGISFNALLSHGLLEHLPEEAYENLGVLMFDCIDFYLPKRIFNKYFRPEMNGIPFRVTIKEDKTNQRAA